jgi:hypothetical protein
MKIIEAPKENVAQNVLMIVSTATTKIKQEITKSVAEGIDQEELTKTLNKIIAEYCKRIDNLELREKTRKSLVTSSRKWYYQLQQTVNILNRNVINNFPGGTYTADIRNLMSNLNKVNLNAIRPYLDQTRKGLAVIEDYRKKLNVALKALAAEPPKVVEVEGRRAYTVSLRNRAEMTVRYEANMRDLERLIAEGVEYVWTSSHPDASPRCAPHQGKLYSINPNNRSGVIDGYRYTYLPDILKLNKGNSIINGYNCRHRLIPYQKGSTPPMEYTKEEIQREYRNDQIQRRYENQIRQLKTEERLMRAAGNIEEAKKLRKRWRRLTKKYEIESLKMGRAFYRWRTVVSEDEEYYTATIAENELINEPKNDIIENIIEVSKDNEQHSLINAKTGEAVKTRIGLVHTEHLKHFTKKNGWYVDWSTLAKKRGVKIYGMVCEGGKGFQGLMAISHDKDTQATYIDWIVTAPHNNKQLTGGTQEFKGVGNLFIAKAAQESIKAGFGGAMYGYANTQATLKHYVEKWGAVHMPIRHPNQVVWDEETAKELIRKYSLEDFDKNKPKG